MLGAVGEVIVPDGSCLLGIPENTSLINVSVKRAAGMLGLDTLFGWSRHLLLESAIHHSQDKGLWRPVTGRSVLLCMSQQTGVQKTRVDIFTVDCVHTTLAWDIHACSHG